MPNKLTHADRARLADMVRACNAVIEHLPERIKGRGEVTSRAKWLKRAVGKLIRLDAGLPAEDPVSDDNPDEIKAGTAEIRTARKAPFDLRNL